MPVLPTSDRLRLATALDRSGVDVRVRRETAALLEYLDTAPLRELRSRSVERRLTEDRFGRP